MICYGYIWFDDETVRFQSQYFKDKFVTYPVLCVLHEWIDESLEKCFKELDKSEFAKFLMNPSYAML